MDTPNKKTFGEQTAHLAAGMGDLKADGYNLLANFEFDLDGR